MVELQFPAVMGIVNLSRNSFYSGSIVSNQNELKSKLEKYVLEGVDIIDIGAASTRPGSSLVDPKLETEELMNCYELVRSVAGNILISIDTINSSTAFELIKMGADIINDVSAAEYDPEIIDVVARFNVPYIAMHMRGIPETMMNEEFLVYDELVSDILKYLARKKFELMKRGVHQIIFDPGFGFSKNLEQNYKLLNSLELFQILDCPILVGLSRKSMFTKLLNIKSSEALASSISANAIALMKGAQILRVHDVREAKHCIEVFKKLKEIEN